MFPQTKRLENGCYHAKEVLQFPERPQDGHTIIFSLPGECKEYKTLSCLLIFTSNGTILLSVLCIFCINTKVEEKCRLDATSVIWQLFICCPFKWIFKCNYFIMNGDVFKSILWWELSQFVYKKGKKSGAHAEGQFIFSFLSSAHYSLRYKSEEFKDFFYHVFSFPVDVFCKTDRFSTN